MNLETEHGLDLVGPVETLELDDARQSHHADAFVIQLVVDILHFDNLLFQGFFDVFEIVGLQLVELLHFKLVFELHAVAPLCYNIVDCIKHLNSLLAMNVSDEVNDLVHLMEFLLLLLLHDLNDGLNPLLHFLLLVLQETKQLFLKLLEHHEVVDVH